jgi:hypothetical protein
LQRRADNSLATAARRCRIFGGLLKLKLGGGVAGAASGSSFNNILEFY